MVGMVVDGQGSQVVWVDGTQDGWGDQVGRGCQYLKAPRAVKNGPLHGVLFQGLTVVSIHKCQI